MSSQLHSHRDYTIGWVCALRKEQTAATAMLDVIHDDLPNPLKDPNAYTLGSIGKHNIVIACLPEGKYGTNAAATAVTWMASAFPSVKFSLMVGIGGGIPSNKIRLGDIVVSKPDSCFPGVIQWDCGKIEQGGIIEHTGSLNNPPTALLTSLAKLGTKREMEGSQIPNHLAVMREKWPALATKYTHLESLRDTLFADDCPHIEGPSTRNSAQESKTYSTGTEEDDEEEEETTDCRLCDMTKARKRKPRATRIHYGLIASGNMVVKEAQFRNRLNERFSNKILCVEMEVAGLMNDFPCLVIRGICDYADSHKNKAWQEYAAAVAAAFAKELLLVVPVHAVEQMDNITPILSDVRGGLGLAVEYLEQVKVHRHGQEDEKILKWLNSVDYGAEHSDVLKRWQPGTGQWLLESTEFREFIKANDKQVLFCPGIPGAGKTVMAATVIDYLHKEFGNDQDTGIAYIYFNFKRHSEQTPVAIFSSLLKQVARQQPSLPTSVELLHETCTKKIMHITPPWIVSTSKPLSVAELQHALGVEIGEDELDEDNLPQVEDIISTTVGLTTIDEESRIIRLVHYTVQEFFERTREKWFPNAETYISEVCSSYLSYSAFETQCRYSLDFLERRASFIFWEYAVTNWKHHAAASRLSHHHLRFLRKASNLQAFRVVYQNPRNVTSLHVAAETGWHAMVEVLLQDTADADERDSRNRSPFHMAASGGYSLVMEALLDSGQIDVDVISNESRYTPLICAAQGGHTAAVKLLLDTGKVNVGFKCRREKTALWYAASPLILLIELGHEGLVKLFLTKEEVDVDLEIEDWYARTPLCAAAYRGRVNIFRLMFDSGRFDLNSRGDDGRTPLMLAAASGNGSLVEFILSKDITTVDWYDKCGFTALHLAVNDCNENANVVELLINRGKASIDIENGSGLALLCDAAENGQEYAFRLLFEMLRTEVNSEDKRSRNLLLDAVVVKPFLILLNTGKFDINERDAHGLTPLTMAAKEGHANIVHILLQRDGVDLYTRDYKYGRTALMWAASNRNPQALMVLLRSGKFDPREMDIGGLNDSTSQA
ncbi:ankyrin repeat-containing domain protein [Trichoderma barbatum]